MTPNIIRQQLADFKEEHLFFSFNLEGQMLAEEVISASGSLSLTDSSKSIFCFSILKILSQIKSQLILFHSHRLRLIIIEAMLLSFGIKVLFSDTKNYINTFKVRSRLSQFFKHIHPDQMVQAPTKIKDENLRSLKNFNSYLDAINQEKPIEGKALKFYISQKTNHKSRKFFSFNIQLPQLNLEQVRMDQEKAGKFIDDIVNALNSKFKESRGILEGKKKEKVILESEVKVETEQERLNREQETLGPFFKTSRQTTVEEQKLKKAINAKYMQSQKQNLKLQLRKNMSFANTSTNKPMMWSRIIMQESGIYNDYQQILSHLIDPKLIFFAEDIGLAEIEEFKKKLLPGELDRLGVRATQAVLQVCQQMQAYNPPVSLFVTSHYSATQIPGFFSIPYNFKHVEMLDYWKKCKHIIISQRVKFEDLYDFFQDTSKDLLKTNNFKVKQPEFKNNADIKEKIQVLQRLEKHTLPQVREVNIFEPEDFRILCHEYQLDKDSTVHQVNSKIFILVAFKEEDLSRIVDRVTEQQNQAKVSS